MQHQQVNEGLTVKAVGELGLLERLRPFCPAGLLDDDAALLEITADHSVVVTTDVLVDGVHFSDRTTRAEDVGWRAVAANLSDLAAMGAHPLGITIGLSLPGEVPVAWVEALYQGMSQCLQPWGSVIYGGDLCRSPVISIAITALGQVRPDQVLRRTTAQVGQVIVVTGVHGASRAGLELLLHSDRAGHLPEQARQALIQAHQRPRPRFDALRLLRPLLAEFDQPAGAIAAMDSSDGLANAVLQICRASGVGASLERSQIPMPPEFRDWLSPQQSLDWALYGGEDFELVLSLPENLATVFVEQLGQGAAIIGSITSDSDVLLQGAGGDSDGHELLSLQQGFQHFI